MNLCVEEERITKKREEHQPDWLRGVHRYRDTQHQRPACSHSVEWVHHNVRCLRITSQVNTPENARVILLVPSLINRYYILDLSAKRSLARYLANSGMIVYLVDWQEPKQEYANYHAADYVTEYINPLMHHLSNKHGSPISVLGYCVGGLLSLATAVLQPKYVDKLALLTTPWDFHATHQNITYNPTQRMWAEFWCKSSPLVPGEYLSWLFYLADPASFEEKYTSFLHYECDSEAYEQFVAVEYWVNDTVPLTRGVAHNCLIDWAQDNVTAKLKWCINETVIDPSAVGCDTLLVIPKHDRIVPPETALSLSKTMKNVRVMTPDTGHIGMVVGRNRHKELWSPLLDFFMKD